MYDRIDIIALLYLVPYSFLASTFHFRGLFVKKKNISRRVAKSGAQLKIFVMLFAAEEASYKQSGNL